MIYTVYRWYFLWYYRREAGSDRDDISCMHSVVLHQSYIEEIDVGVDRGDEVDGRQNWKRADDLGAARGQQ